MNQNTTQKSNRNGLSITTKVVEASRALDPIGHRVPTPTPEIVDDDYLTEDLYLERRNPPFHPRPLRQGLRISLRTLLTITALVGLVLVMAYLLG